VSKHWVALNKSNYQWFNRICNEVELIFYSENAVSKDEIKIGSKTFKLVHLTSEPYPNQAKMKEDYSKN